jgi:hypothetical protein
MSTFPSSSNKGDASALETPSQHITVTFPEGSLGLSLKKVSAAPPSGSSDTHLDSITLLIPAYAYVHSVKPESAAEKAGILVGDLLVSVQGVRFDRKVRPIGSQAATIDEPDYVHVECDGVGYDELMAAIKAVDRGAGQGLDLGFDRYVTTNQTINNNTKQKPC